MSNNITPPPGELPSKRQLLRSTLVALLVAAALLVTVVLPAEYGIDPSGIGRLLNLTEMGEIKTSLALEAAAVGELSGPAGLGEAASSTLSAEKREAAREAVGASARKDQLAITLAPGAVAEVKLSMDKGAVAEYRWSTQGGIVNFDTHGDGQSTSYHGYGKGRDVSSDEGSLVAAFDGKHGWFWRNRAKMDVTITLITSGAYSSITRVL